MKTQIKPANIEQITHLANGNPYAIQGEKLKALYTLIQKKGEPVQTDDKELKLNGVMCLEITNGQFVAIKRVGPKDKFFPCVLHTYLLTTI